MYFTIKPAFLFLKKKMKDGYIIRDPYAKHFVTLSVVYWIDIFSRQLYRDIVIDSFKYCQEHMGLTINGYVIMSNHIHAILQCQNGKLSQTITSFKKFTGTKFIQSILDCPESRRVWLLNQFAHASIVHNRNSSHQIWVNGNRPMSLTTGTFFWQKLNYIHNNPVRAGIVDNPEDYIYSSARNYLGREGKLKIELVDWVKW